MKWILTILAYISLSLNLCATGEIEESDRPAPYTAPWLELGIAASIVCHTSGSNPTPEQIRNCQHLQIYLVGIMQGIESAAIIGKSSADKSLSVPRKTTNLTDSAPSLLQYINEQRAFIQTDTPAYDIVTGWYIKHHPDTSEVQKIMAERHIEFMRDIRAQAEREKAAEMPSK